MDTAWMQHDVYFRIQHDFAVGNMLHSGVSYLYGMARSTRLPLPVYDNRILPKRFDHRVLQESMMIISAYYRWNNRHSSANNNALSEVNSDSDKEREETGDARTHDTSARRKYMTDAWKLYFKYEVNDICFGAPSIAERILRAVRYQNTETGYVAEKDIENFLYSRYGIEFKQACDAYAKNLSDK